ncbi:MAG: hypothetical protein HY237_03045 [Acidobacteria bacterium]|nr:hypothetical protein [Acidobacteriota bacterium]
MPTSKKELKDAMGEWLGLLAPWDVFSTYTFSRLVNTGGAMFWGRRHLSWLEKVAQQPIYAFLGVERGEAGGLLHLHALLGNVGHLKPFCGVRLPSREWARGCCMVHAWPCGHARVLPYDPELGARYYVSNYVAKGLAEWDLIGFPAAPQFSFSVS